MDNWRELAYPVLRLLPFTLEYKAKKTAESVIRGEAVLFPSDSVNTVGMDGRKKEPILRIRKVKGRQSNQREGIIIPANLALKYIDFEKLKEINPEITPEKISELFAANPCGQILPCNDKVESHLSLDRNVNGKCIRTALFVSNSRYLFWQLLWRELYSKDPEIVLVGSSANVRGEPPLDFSRAKKRFSGHVGFTAKDRKVKKHLYPGSYTIFDHITFPSSVYRKGNIHPEKHPEVFKGWVDVLDGRLVIPKG